MKFWERLDGYVFQHRVLTYAMFPGRVILWLNYMTARGGFARSARQARSPAMVVYYSIAFYVALIIALFVLLKSAGDHGVRS